MLTIDISNVYNILSQQKNVPYESEVRRLAKEYSDKVQGASWGNISPPNPITCDKVRAHLRTITLIALGSYLSSYVRRDAKYDRSDLSDAYGLHEEWMLLRKSHGKEGEHPTSSSYLGDLARFQWNYKKAARHYKKAAEINLSLDNKYPALPNLFNASYCHLRCDDIEQSQQRLREIEDAVQRIRNEHGWEEKYRAQSLTSFKEFDLSLWSYLGWCDHYIHHPNWATDESVRASFEGKWDLLTSGRHKNSVLTLDLATSIFSDPQWARNQREIVDVIWKSLYLDYSRGRIARVARVAEMLVQRKVIDYGKKVAVLVLSCALVFGGSSQDAVAWSEIGHIYSTSVSHVQEFDLSQVHAVVTDMKNIGLIDRGATLSAERDEWKEISAMNAIMASDERRTALREIMADLNMTFLSPMLSVGTADQDITDA